jgi:hypothetical protein
VILAEKPGDAPHIYIGGSGFAFPYPKTVFINKSWSQLLTEAPIGSQITWANQDAIDKCYKDPNLPFCDFRYENTLKLGPNRYAAHPLGILNKAQIETKMAQAVVGKAEASYIAKYIYISAIRHPK